jgi:uncharacterized membrane protein YgcG
MRKRTVQVIGILVVAAVLASTTMVFAAQGLEEAPSYIGNFQDTIEPVNGPTETPVSPYPDFVIDAIADYFGVPADEVRQLYDSGVGLGLIVHLYALSETLGITPQQMLAEKEASGLGWGQFIGLGQMEDKEAGKEARQSVTLGSIMSEFSGQKINPNGTPEPDQTRDRTRDQERVQLRESGQDPGDGPQQEQAQEQTQAQTQEQAHEQLKSSGAGQGGNDGGNGNSGGNGGGNSGGGGGNSSGGGGRGKNK